MPSWNEIRDALESGKTVVAEGIWRYTIHGYTCDVVGCCEDSFRDINDAMEYLQDDGDADLSDFEIE